MEPSAIQLAQPLSKLGQFKVPVTVAEPEADAPAGVQSAVALLNVHVVPRDAKKKELLMMNKQYATELEIEAIARGTKGDTEPSVLTKVESE